MKTIFALAALLAPAAALAAEVYRIYAPVIQQAVDLLK